MTSSSDFSFIGARENFGEILTPTESQVRSIRNTVYGFVKAVSSYPEA